MIGAILTLGLGVFGSVNLLPTIGYSAGQPAPVPQDTNTPGYTTLGYKPRYAGHGEEEREARRRAREALKTVPVAAQAIIVEVAKEPFSSLTALMDAFEDAGLQYRATYLRIMELQREAQLIDDDAAIAAILIAAAV